MTPNQDQILGILRILIPVALAWFVGKGFITHEAVAEITAAIVTLLAAVGSAWSHTHASTVAKVAAMPGTTVMMTPKGDTVIALHDVDLIHAAGLAATPVSGKWA